MNKTKLNCHNAKCRRAFLTESLKNQEGGKVKKYFKLLSRMGSKDQRFVKYLQSDLKYFVQKGGACESWQCEMHKNDKNSCLSCINDSDKQLCNYDESRGYCEAKNKIDASEALKIEIYNPFASRPLNKYEPNKNEIQLYKNLLEDHFPKNEINRMSYEELKEKFELLEELKKMELINKLIEHRYTYNELKEFNIDELEALLEALLKALDSN